MKREFSLIKFRYIHLVISVIFFSVFLFSSCEEDDNEDQGVIETGMVSDIDGNIYKTVKIGGKWWMAENLKVRHYRDGNEVTEIVPDSSWDTDNPGYSNHPDAIAAMGNLYNWAAVSNPAGLAPMGWHIPSDEEWKELERALGMEVSTADLSGWRGGSVGDALKEKGTENWYYDPNNPGGPWPTNSSGFSALSGSCRLFNGEFGYPGIRYTGFWWTSSSSGPEPDKAWYRYLDYKNSEVFRSYVQKRYGMSIRCVKDE